MTKRLLPLLLLAVLGALPAQAPAALIDPAASLPSWAPVAGDLAARGIGGARVETRPREFAAFTLNRAALEPRLAAAPLEATRLARRAPAVVAIPAPDGTLQRFAAVDSPVMEPGLARRHPEIVGTFAGVGLDDRTATVRFDLTALGFHASVRSDDGAWYVDPYYKGDDVTHVAYFGRDLPNVHGPLVEPEDVTPATARRAGERQPPPGPGEAVIQRTYRLAFLTDPAYATYFGGGANVASANATLINRVNQVYNDDLAIRMELIADNDAVNLDTSAEFSGPLGPCGTLPCFSPPATGSECDTQTLLRNQQVIDQIIGDANYDVGHIGLGAGGGGVAGLGVVGRTGQKARGCTGLPTPKGDFYAIDYVAHEIGHQFGGNHTWNGANGSCSAANVNEDTAVEPGSGTSVMAYAGICGVDNLQPHSDPYFSQKSVDEIQAYVTTPLAGEEEEGSTVVTTANNNPTVTAPAARTIPVRTPFTLAGSATDANAGQSLIYLWEQNNAGPGKALLSNTKANGPLFRVFSFIANVSATDALLSPSPGINLATADDFTRTFPDAAQVAAGNTNASTGSCPAASSPPTPAQIDCYSEFLPTSARTLNFRLTARDRFATGGGLAFANTVVTVAGTAPFRVTSQATPASLTGNAVLPVTWDVAGTSAAPFNAPNVKVSYSTDGGLTFPTVLLASTANDGSESITLPNVATTQGRIKVEAVDNYFFDVSRGNLTVTASTATPTPSPSVTPSPVASPTVTATATPTVTPTASPYVVPTPTVTPTVIPIIRVKPGLSVRVKPRRDRTRPFRYRVTGRLRLPAGVDPAVACAGQRVGVVVKGRVKRTNPRSTVRPTCDFALRVRLKGARGRGKVKLRVRIDGNQVLSRVTKTKTVKFGRP